MRAKELLSLTIATSLLWACTRSEAQPSDGVMAATPNIYPGETIIPTSTLEPNEYLLTPGAIESQIIATAQSANLELLVQEGKIQRKAVDTLVKINYGGTFGSGNLARLFGYPGIITSGHLFVEGPQNAMLGISTPGLPNEAILSFGESYKYSYLYTEGLNSLDFGVIVFTDPDAIEYLNSNFSDKNFLNLDDLNFNRIQPNSTVSGVCYTSPSDNTPYPFYDSNYIGDFNSLWQIDNALTYKRCSGGGIFDSDGKYIANLVKGYDFSQFTLVHPNDYDDSFVSSLHSIGGYEGLESLFNSAINQVK